MKRYRKSIVALLGLLVIAGKEVWGVDLGIDPAASADTIIDLVTAGATLVGVYAIPNKDTLYA